MAAGSGLVVLELFVLYVPGKKCGKKCGRGSRVLWPATCNRINAAKLHVTNCIICLFLEKMSPYRVNFLLVWCFNLHLHTPRLRRHLHVTANR